MSLRSGSTKDSTTARRWRIGLAALAACVLVPTALARAASFLPIDPAGDDPNHVVVVAGISGDGRVVVGGLMCTLDCGGAPTREAIRWTEAGGLERLGLLPGGTAESMALGASEDGSQIVGFSHSATGTAAFRWQRETGLVDLDPGPPAGLEERFGVARAISADGAVVVGSRLVERRDVGPDELPIEVHRPFVWTGSVGLRDLDVPDARGPNNGAYDVSADGAIVVGAAETTRGIEAFVWDEVRGLQPIGGLTIGDEVESAASAISADGTTIVGTSATSFDANGRSTSGEAFVYTRAGGMQRLGDAAARWTWSGARDVSGDGSIVVGQGVVDPFTGEGDAFVYDADHGVRLLADVLASLGVDLAGWRLSSADAISRDGTTIIGSARDPEGRFRSYVAVIPEPTTALLVGLGLAGLAGLAGRSSGALGGRRSPSAGPLGPL
ncbi:MAG: hypothetical protein U0900_07915 [Myxococcota bacterium]